MEAMREISLPYGEGELKLHVPARNLLAVLSPRSAPPCPDPMAEVRRALGAPIGVERLARAASGARKVVIAADDLTRQTPVQAIVPALLDELNSGGIGDKQITVLIALGTHRSMTPGEIAERFGTEVTRRVKVLNNPWQNPAEMADLGLTANGTSLQVSRAALEADFLVGVGSIVPHHIPGYSGGAKIVQPGLTGAATTGATHFLSTRTRRSYLGLVENPVRQEMEQIASRVGLKTVFNVVLNSKGELVRAFYGDFRLAHRAGAEAARQVYSVPLPGQADIVIAGSHPCDLEFWQAHKSLYPADMAVKERGDIIVVTPCTEGVAVMHSDMLEFTALPSARMEVLIENGTIHDMAAGGLALAWAKVRERAQVSLVSGGIAREAARALGFSPFDSPDEALAEALRRHGPDARVTVLTHSPDTLPVLS